MTPVVSGVCIVIKSSLIGTRPSVEFLFSFCLCAVLLVIAQPASAQDLRADSGTPSVFFDDSFGVGVAPAWTLKTTVNNDNGVFSMVDDRGGTVPFRIDSMVPNADSFVVDGSGDLHLADFAVFIDRSLGFVGINTQAPDGDLHIAGSDPRLVLEDIGNGGGGLVYEPGALFLGLDTDGNGVETGPFSLIGEAPDQSLNVVAGSRGDGQGDGLIGMGTAAPSKKLHLSGGDDASGKNNSSAALVENNSSVTANRVMAELVNNGNPQMLYRNTATGDTWQINPIGRSFVIALGGTGVQEARFTSSGGLVLAGALTENSDRDSKASVEAIDAEAILEGVLNLPVSSWQYRRDESGARHIGPMAQDFHAAFGLGDAPTTISTLDTSGVALAAIQGLNQSLRAELVQRDETIRALEARLAALEHRLGETD